MSKTDMVTDGEIREGFYNHESDGHTVTHISSLGAAMQDAGTIHVNERRDRAFMRELGGRCKKMVEAGTLEAVNSGYRLPEPPAGARFTLALKGERDDVQYAIEGHGTLDPSALADLLSNITGLRADYIRRVVLSAIVAPGKARQMKVGFAPLRLILERVADESKEER